MDIEQYVIYDHSPFKLHSSRVLSERADQYFRCPPRFRKAGYQAIDRICDYYASLQNRPVVAQVLPGYLLHSLPRKVFTAP